MKSICNRLKTWRQNTSKFLIPKYAREAAMHPEQLPALLYQIITACKIPQFPQQLT